LRHRGRPVALVDRDVESAGADAVAAVEQDAVADDDATGVRALQAGHGTQRGDLPAPGWAEKRGHLAVVDLETARLAA
jgi:hypothetical protein